MIIYITGASGTGKTTLLKKLPIKGYDLDDIYEANWKKHRKLETVQKGVKKDVDELVSKHKNIVFVGLQSKEQLAFEPDVVYILVRKDYETYYRDKLIRDLNLLCTYKAEFEDVLRKKPFEEFREHFWSNSIVNMKTLDEFKTSVNKMNKYIQEDFPRAKMLTANEILREVKSKT
jgi:adenylate kinase family enzyme